MSATRKTKPDESGPREADFYPTPAWAVEVVADLVLDSMPPSRPVLYVPGAGEGAILRGMLIAGHPIEFLRGCELRDEAAARCRGQGFMVWTQDWLREGPAAACDIGTFVQNPPYGGRMNLAQQFVQRCLERAAKGTPVWALLRVNWLLDGEASFGRQTWLREGPGTPNVHGLNKRPSFDGTGKADATTYAWCMWIAGERIARPAMSILDCQERKAAAPL